MLPKWSTPQRVVKRHLNSYTLETLHGDPIPGFFSARRLRGFIPKEGTKLAEEQKQIEERYAREEQEEKGEEVEELEENRPHHTPEDINPNTRTSG